MPVCVCADSAWRTQLLTIMSSSIAYLTSKANFMQVSPDVPITKQRNPEKVDPPEVFEGALRDRAALGAFLKRASRK